MSDTVDSSQQSRSSGKKSPEAFRTISEVADTLNVPQHVLRFWESKFSQVKPMKRGGGRRYYRPEDVQLLRGIRNLLYHEGYTIRGVQKVLREAGTKVVVDAGRETDATANGDRQVEAGAQAPADQSAVATSTEAGVGDAPVSQGISADQRAKLEGMLASLKEIRSELKGTD